MLDIKRRGTIKSLRPTKNIVLLSVGLVIVFSFRLNSVGEASETLRPGHHPNCCTIMYCQMLRETHFSPSRQELLQEIAVQADVLQRTSHLLLEKDTVSPTDSL